MLDKSKLNIKILLYIFIYSIGFIKVTWIISSKLSQYVFKAIPYTINEWVRMFFYPDKRFILFSYIITISVIFLYYFILYLLIASKNKGINKELGKFNKSSKKQLFIYYAMALIANIFIAVKINIYTISKNSIRIAILIWLLIFVLPIFWQKINKYCKNVLICIWNSITRIFTSISEINVNMKILNRFYYAVFFIIIITLFYNFSSFVFSKQIILNEYLDIPEETIINGKYIDNNEFVNSRSLLIDHNKYSLEENKGKNPALKEGTYAHISKNEELVKFCINEKNKYYYDNVLKVLCLLGEMKNEEKNTLKEIVISETEKLEIDKLYKSNRILYSKYSSPNKEIENNIKLKGIANTEEERDFIKKNQYEMQQQYFNRWVIHHHNFVLGPINEYALGRNINEIYMQYGYLNTMIMKMLLDKFGGINYQNYFKVWYSFYYLYFIIFIVLIFILFKRIDYVVMTLLLSLGTFYNISFQLITLGPGLNPIRHFFDIFIVGFLYLYLQKRQKKYFYLTLAFAIIGIINNSQLGVIALISLVFVLFVVLYKESKERTFGQIFSIIGSIIIGIIVYSVMKKGYDPYSHYYLEGLAGFPVDLNYIKVFLIILSSAYIVVLMYLHVKDNLKYILIFLILYSQAMFLYFVWGATMPHLHNFAMIYILTVTILFKIIFDNFRKLKKSEHIVNMVLICISFVFFINALILFYNTKKEYFEIFKTHRTYEWKLDKAQFTSTMNPKYFENSISLIQKYSKENGIYIISKYDNFLPILSNKYSAMPYFDIQWFVITQKEVNECINRINDKKPEYLFVDSDINRNLIFDKISDKIYLVGVMSNESEWRIQRINLLKDIFNSVKDDYLLVEQGYLITAYKRKLINR